MARSGKPRAAVAVALAVVAAVCLALLARHGAFSSERELGADDVEQILEASYGLDLELTSVEGGVHVTGESPKLDAQSDPVSFDVSFEHVYHFTDGRGLSCTVWQQYRADSDGSLARANQLYDDCWWQQLKPRLARELRKRSGKWPGSWELVDTPLHPHLEVSVKRFSDLGRLKAPIARLRACARGLSAPRQNAASFHADGSPFAGLKHLPEPLMPRVDVLAGSASDGEPYLLSWFTPFGTRESYEQGVSKAAFRQLRAAYARGVQNGDIAERLPGDVISRNLSDVFTRTSFYLGGAGPKSSNAFAWSYSAKAADFTIPGARLRDLVETMGGYYLAAQDSGTRVSQWNLGDSVWEAEPVEGSDGSFDEGTLDLTSAKFTRNGDPLVVFDPDTPASLKRCYTLAQLEKLLGAEVRADLASGTVRIVAHSFSGSQGIGLD